MFLDRLRLLLMQLVDGPNQFNMPSKLEGHCTTDSQDAMLALLMKIYQKKGRWVVLSLETIGEHVIEASRSQDHNNVFRSLPDRVMEHGLRALCEADLLREKGNSNRLRRVKYAPTEKFFRSIVVFHVTWRPLHATVTRTL